VGTASVAHTLGRAYSAADAERAFSTATDPALPPGTTPTSDATAAFPETRAASPTQLAFASDAQPAQPVSEQPTPSEPDPPGETPASDSPRQPADQPAEQPQPDPADRPAEDPVVAGATATSETLPFTGLNVTTIAALGLLLMAMGALGRRATRSPAASSAHLPARP
jgi:hypothetical protein